MVYGNFKIWNEVDPNSKLTQSIIKATWTNMIRNEACYLHRLKTTPAEYYYEIELRVTSIDVNADASNNKLACIWQICEAYGRPEYSGDVGKNIAVYAIEKGTSTTLYQLHLTHKDDNVNDTSVDMNVGQTYYLTIKKTDTIAVCTIFLNSTRSASLDTIVINLSGEDEENMSFSYIQTTGSSDNASDGNDQSDGWVNIFSYNDPSDNDAYTFTILNDVGEIEVKMLEWKESQTCDVAVKPVPLRSGGAVIDSGTYQPRIRKITSKVRLSGTEKTTLKTIMDGVKKVSISIGDWIYTAWIKNKEIRYEYVDDGTLRPWETTLTFDCEDLEYVG